MQGGGGDFYTIFIVYDNNNNNFSAISKYFSSPFSSLYSEVVSRKSYDLDHILQVLNGLFLDLLASKNILIINGLRLETLIKMTLIIHTVKFFRFRFQEKRGMYCNFLCPYTFFLCRRS